MRTDPEKPQGLTDFAQKGHEGRKAAAPQPNRPRPRKAVCTSVGERPRTGFSVSQRLPANKLEDEDEKILAKFVD